MSDEDHYHRIRNLVRGLTERTESLDEGNRLKWEGVGPDSYELSLARSSLRIRSEDEEGSSYPYVFIVVDESGNEIEEVKAWNSRSDDYDLADLFSAASRSHRGVSEKLTEIFQELGIDDPPALDEDPWSSTPDDSPF